MTHEPFSNFYWHTQARQEPSIQESDPNSPACGIDGEEVIDCWNCMDKGFTVTVGGFQIPCPDCKTGDMFFYHEREKDLAAMVHVDDDPIQDHAMPGYDETDE